jgi:transcriptional regulator with XRE-family HTH domain
MTLAERLTGRLIGLKFQMEDYFRSEKPSSEYSFGYFLKLYIKLLDKTRRGFAEEIGVDETLISQLVNHRRTPPEYVPIQLELHSNNSIPAEYWFRVIEKDREGVMFLNKSAMRKKERRYVTGGISLRL